MNRIWKLGLVGATTTFLCLEENRHLCSLSLARLCQFKVNAEDVKDFSAESFQGVDLSKPLDLSKKPRHELGTDQCILVVGTTGSGKSSTIAKLTGQKVRVGDRADSVTRRCQSFRKSEDENQSKASVVWVDTVGYDDTSNIEDQESFKEILRYIADQGLTKVKAVVWTVLPQERRDQRLQRQADFINQFREGRMWENVIIVVKQPGSFNLNLAAQGARESARQHCYRGEDEGIQVLGFTYLDASIPEEIRESIPELDPIQRRKMLLVTDSEVVQEVEEALARIENPVQVVFEDSECPDCGVVGDKRLLPDFCHMEQMFRHPQLLTHYHPAGDPQPYHPLQIKNYHTGVQRLEGGPSKTCETVRNVAAAMTVLGHYDLTTGVVSGVVAGATHLVCEQLKTPLQYVFTCCKGDLNSPGCKSMYACCNQPSSNTGCCFIYTCCQGGIQAAGCATRYRCCNKEEGSIGCQVVCKKCGLEWGSPAGKCFKKKHQLRPIRT